MHFIAMPTSSRKIVINKGYVGDDSATNESLGLKQISLKEANFGAASDPGSALYETHEEKPHRQGGRTGDICNCSFLRVYFPSSPLF